MRLLWLLRQLRALDAEVSLLLRAATPAARRSPPTAEVAALLGAASDVAHVLRDNATAPTPPARYELGDSAALAALLGAGHFDLVLLGVWFWYDPQPAFAELLLPVIQAYAEWRPPCDATDSCAAADAAPDDDGGDAAAASGRRRRPAIALLLDDAHAERAARLAAEETDGASARTYLAQSRNFGARTRQIYAAADLLLYLTATDMAADAPQRGGLARGLRMDARLLRMPAQVGVLPGSDDNTTTAASRRRRRRRRRCRASASWATGGRPPTTSGSSDFCARAGRCCARCRRARGCGSSAASLTPIGRASGRAAGGGAARRAKCTAGGRGRRRARRIRVLAASTPSAT